jgi:4-amino-4-deoxy-L-arabinose transferase-like glycosyltransferase
VATVIYGWSLADVQLHAYYAPAVKSMSESWKAFFYGGYDPVPSITLDKLSGPFMLQALFARVLGFRPWVLVLPNLIAAVITVLVLYRLVRRWQGPVAGLLAAACYATTPMVAALARSQISDAMLVLLLVLAADAAQRAADSGRLRWLLLSGLWAGLAFQAKMVQAWAVLPAIALAYFVAAAAPVTRRLLQLGAFGLVTVAISLWQPVLFALTPAADRPYADGSTNNSLFATVFEYNLANRFGVTSDTAVNLVGPGAREPTHWWYLLSDQAAPQVGWLYPVALAGLVLGLLALRTTERDAARRTALAGFLLWGTWLLIHVIAFSIGRVAHPFYVVALAPPTAALAGAGLVMLWTRYRQTGPRWWLLPAVLAVSLVWTVYLNARFAGFRPWLGPVLVMVGLATIALLVLGRRDGWAVGPLTRRTAVAAGLALVTVLLPPAVWTAATTQPAYAGPALAPSAGPPASGDQVRQATLNAKTHAIGTTPSPETRKLLDYLTQRNSGERYLVAVQGSVQSGQLIVAGATVLPMGGFSSHAPFPSVDQIAALVADRELRFVLLGARKANSDNQAVEDWVVANCKAAVTTGRQALYDCRPKQKNG